jgi:hypothetical protein
MTDKKTFVCDICDYSSPYKANLERHKRAKHQNNVEKDNSTVPNASSSEPSVDDILEDLKRSKKNDRRIPPPVEVDNEVDDEDDDEIPITEYIDARIEQRMGAQNTQVATGAGLSKASNSITGTFGSVAFGFALAWMAMNNYSMIKTMIVGTIGAGEKKTIPPELLRALSEKQPPMPYLPSAEVPPRSVSSTPSSSSPVCVAPSSSSL